MTGQEILDKVGNYGISLVEITGGEPLLQKDVFKLIRDLIDAGYKVLVETNGSISIREIDNRAVIILDIKTPGSGMSGKMDITNFDHIKKTDEIKFVISQKSDYEWSKEMIKQHGLINKCNILISPAYGILSPEELAGWILQDRLNVRLNIQIQKCIYGHDKRGV